MAIHHRKLTEAFIAKGIKAPTKKGQQDEYFDEVVRGLCVRIGTSGRKSYSLVYRVKGDGKLRRGTLGMHSKGPHYEVEMKLSDAREEARRYLVEAVKGVDPFKAHKPNQEVLTFGVLAESYIEDYAQGERQNRTWKNDKRKLESKFGTWDGKPADSITQNDVIDKILYIQKHNGRYMANRCRSLILKLFKWARQQRLIPANPVPDPGEIPKAREMARDRVLTDAEVAHFWAGCEAIGYPFGQCFQLMLILGRRESAVGGMRWPDINLETGEWTNPSSAEKTKRTEVVPLPPLVVGILRTIHDKYHIEDCDYVFSTNGKSPISGWSKAKKAIDATCKGQDKEIQEAWQLKDLRRTCRTNLPRVGTSQFIARITIGHAITGIDKVYDRYSYMKEKREALENWSALLEGLVNKRQTATVTRLSA